MQSTGERRIKLLKLTSQKERALTPTDYFLKNSAIIRKLWHITKSDDLSIIARKNMHRLRRRINDKTQAQTLKS